MLGGEWLCRSELERARLLDMTRRVMPATMFASALCGVAVAVLLPIVGTILLAPLALGVAGQVAIGFVFPRLRHPERWILVGDCISVTAITWGAALSGGLVSPVLPVLVLPLVVVAGRHTRRAFVTFAALCIAAPFIAEAFAINARLHYGNTYGIADLATVAGLAAEVIALMRAEWHFRHQSLLDPLTGLLNRLALEHRFAELAVQGTVAPGHLSLLVADLDNFKEVNDTHGHELGDIVLREVADELRSSLRAFSLPYRLGGEEFVALLPGLDSREGALVAERLRAAIERRRPLGLELTMSFGVACASGEQLSYDALFSAADRCLYEAKHGGRNLVVAADASGAPRRLDEWPHAPASPPPRSRRSDPVEGARRRRTARV